MMRKISGKVPAFTLLEMTVSMLVAAIVISLTFTAYKIVSRSYLVYDQRNEKISRLVMIDRLLKKDFHAAREIRSTENGIEMELKDGLIRYDFSESSVTRDQYKLRIDTFPLKTMHYRSSFEGSEVTISGLLDQLELESRWEDTDIVLRYFKLYSAEDLVE